MLYEGRSLSRMLSMLICLGTVATPVTLHAAPHKEIDLRTMSEPTGEYGVSLCSRPSPSGNIPGHAFVAYSYKPHDGNRRVLSLGFTTSASPVKAALSYNGWLTSVDGYLGEERYTSIKEKCLVTLVDKKVFDVAWALAHPFASVPGLDNLQFIGEYKLGENDCMKFMVDVAKALKGVKVPARGSAELPQPYLRRLIDSN